MTLLGHLGTKVTDLLDGRLGERASDNAWLHVGECAACQSEVETEAWVKRSLSSLAATPVPHSSESLKGRLAADRLVAAHAGAEEWPDDWAQRNPAHHDRRHRWAVAAIGSGAIGAAMLGIVVVAGATGTAPTVDRRTPIANLRAPSESVRTTPARASVTPGSRSGIASGMPSGGAFARQTVTGSESSGAEAE